MSELEKSANLIFGSIKIQIQIESALGLSNITSIASSSDRITSLIFGPGDFAASLGMQVANIGENPINYPGTDAYHYVLFSILVAARAKMLKCLMTSLHFVVSFSSYIEFEADATVFWLLASQTRC